MPAFCQRGMAAGHLLRPGCGSPMDTNWLLLTQLLTAAAAGPLDEDSEIFKQVDGLHKASISLLMTAPGLSDQNTQRRFIAGEAAVQGRNSGDENRMPIVTGLRVSTSQSSVTSLCKRCALCEPALRLLSEIRESGFSAGHSSCCAKFPN